MNKFSEYIKEYTHDLPHGKELLKKMCESWNKSNMHQFYDGILSNNIIAAKMRPVTELDNEGNKAFYGKIEITGKPGFRFSQKIREEIDEQTSAQITDGWGETFLGSVNIITMPDGTRCYAD